MEGLKEKNIEVSKISNVYGDNGYYVPCFFYSNSLHIGTYCFLYTFNGITVPYNTLKRLSLHSETHDDISFDELLNNSSFDAEQKEAIQKYLQYLIMLIDYTRYLDRYIFFSR